MEEKKETVAGQKQLPKKGCLITIVIVVLMAIFITMCSSSGNENGEIVDYSVSPVIKTVVKEADKNSIGYKIATSKYVANELRKIIINKNLSANNDDNKNITIELNATEGFMPKISILSSSVNILKTLPKEIPLSNITLVWFLPLVDNVGNKSDEDVLHFQISKSRVDSIDWDTFLYDDFPSVTSVYWEHPAIGK